MFTNNNKSTFNTPPTLNFGFANNPYKTPFGNVNNDASRSGFFGSSESDGFFGKFGQTTQQSPFGSTHCMASNNPFQNLFNQNVQPGTVLKYSPLISSDLVQRAGITETINTKLNCITCMKEYEGKSLEELRFEDYQTGRKNSHSQTPVSEANSFKVQVPTIQPSFGQNENKNLFGQSLFGQNTTFNVPTRPTTSLISKPSTFGASSNNNRPFGFGSVTQTSSLSSINNAKPFTTALTTPTFRTNLLQQNNFNKSNLFDQSNTGGIFSNPQTSLNQTFGNKTALFAPRTNEKSVQNTSFGFTSFGQNVVNSTSQNFSKPFNVTPATCNTLTSSSLSNPLSSFPQPLSSANVANPSLLNKPPELTSNNFSTFTSNNQPKPVFMNQPQMQNPISPEPQKFDASNVLQITSPFGFIEQFKGLTPIIKADIEESLNILSEKPKVISEISSVITQKQETPKFKPSVIKTKKVLNTFDLDELESGSHRVDLRSCRKLLILKNKVNAPPTSIRYLFEPKETPSLPVSFLEHISETAHQKETICKEVDKNLIIEETPKKEEIPKLELKETPQYKLNETCGVILTRVEYYTIPPVEELHKYSDESGRCIIKGFTVGRTGYGNIHFLDEVDLTNLNLDEIVHFRHREVLIYPDDSTKPPFGQGLNRPAQITLDRVWPNDKDKNIITDVEVIAKSNFSDKLKELCKRKKVNFKEYRPETGSWVFTIDQL